ncbi:MAG: hypothetical protein A2475_02585 [Ignavibacteria bacterium RIFOXYC2_FULL_35_21]|nr:MAG: hypothetical protein A2220_00100 [Ignavibacteria bacterium RIFOXYA2_FULL_35_10]OGV19323.1 MAG: hypothetical protein A2475_02585 [Ignavibacteria bacterium RIFOXYC2_FULL_35_21]
MEIKLREDVDYPPIHESHVYILYHKKYVGEEKLKDLSLGNSSLFFPGINLANASGETTGGWLLPVDYKFDSIEKLREFVADSIDEEGVPCVYFFYDHEVDKLLNLSGENIEKCYKHAQMNNNELTFIALHKKSFLYKHRDAIWESVDLGEYYDFVKGLKR